MPRRAAWAAAEGEERCLHLLGSPTSVGFAHVGGWLDLGDELENDVRDADNADDRAGDDAQDVIAEEDGANEDVDCAHVSPNSCDWPLECELKLTDTTA